MSMMWIWWVFPVLVVLGLAWIAGRRSKPPSSRAPGHLSFGDDRAELETQLVSGAISEAEFRRRLRGIEERSAE